MLMSGSTRSPALLVQFISEENTHNSYPGVFKARVRCEASDRRQAVQFKSHPRCVSVGSNDEPRWQVYFSYCATCLWSEESLQKLQWSERSEFGVQRESRMTIESMRQTLNVCVSLSPLPLSFCLSIAKKQKQKNFGYNNTTTTTDNKIFFIFCVMIKISFQIQGAGRF